MEKSIAKNLLFNFFEGKHTTLEARMIEEWLRIDENKELYFDFLNEWELLNPQHITDVEARFTDLINQLESSKESESIAEILPVEKRKRAMFIRVAASITLLFLIGGYLFFSKMRGTNSYTNYQTNVEAVKQVSGEIFEKQNLGDSPLLVNLPDGSSVLLQPEAKISYNPKNFGVNRREVIMEGEAFFEVYKDQGRPFFVYANDLIAKVLGTSFTIRALPASQKAEVFVKSGRVSVFTQSDSKKNAKLEGSILQGVVLNPAEKIEINSSNPILPKPTKIQQRDLSEVIQTLSFNFEEARAEKVFNTLERAYNIEIVYDKGKFSSLKLTAHLGDEPLGEKLKLICLALETSYQEIDEKIIILSQNKTNK